MVPRYLPCPLRAIQRLDVAVADVERAAARRAHSGPVWPWWGMLRLVADDQFAHGLRLHAGGVSGAHFLHGEGGKDAADFRMIIKA